VGPQARNIIFRGRTRLPGYLPGSQASTWLEPGTVSCGATILLCFAWLLSFPTWGSCGCASLLPTPAYELQLTGESTKPSNMCRPIPSYCIGQHNHRLPFWLGAMPLGQAICLSVDRPNLLWTECFTEKPPLLRRTYLMSE
jgi:hypothetical protein